LKARLDVAPRLCEQRRDAKNKLYVLPAPEVECLPKCKARMATPNCSTWPL